MFNNISDINGNSNSKNLGIPTNASAATPTLSRRHGSSSARSSIIVQSPSGMHRREDRRRSIQSLDMPQCVTLHDVSLSFNSTNAIPLEQTSPHAQRYEKLSSTSQGKPGRRILLGSTNKFSPGGIPSISTNDEYVIA